MRWLLLFAAACSSNGDTGDDVPDEMCQVLGGGAASGSVVSAPGDDTFYSAPIPGAASPGSQYAFTIAIHRRGVFANGFAPGTYSAEKDPATCGLCVAVGWRVPGSGGALHTRATYHAMEGKITIMSETAPMGSVENVRFNLVSSDLAPPVPCMLMPALPFSTN